MHCTFKLRAVITLLAIRLDQPLPYVSFGIRTELHKGNHFGTITVSRTTKFPSDHATSHHLLTIIQSIFDMISAHALLSAQVCHMLL